MRWNHVIAALLALSLTACAGSAFPNPSNDKLAPAGSPQETIVLAGGCFWGIELVFENMTGVSKAVAGYAGGTKNTARYETVSEGNTGHAESVEVTYDPSKVSFGQLLKVFFSVAHDHTQLNRQGNDQGRQYRSAIFTANDEQKKIAEAYIRQLNDANVFGGAPIVTEVTPLEQYYEGEAYHQDYAASNPRQSYIAYTAAPKVEKLRKYFGDRLKQA